MKSRLAEAALQRWAENGRHMTPDQQLAAFLAHFQLMASLANEGDTSRRGRLCR